MIILASLLIFLARLITPGWLCVRLPYHHKLLSLLSQGLCSTYCPERLTCRHFRDSGRLQPRCRRNDMAVSHRSHQSCPACPLFRRSFRHTLPRSVQAGDIGFVLAFVSPDADSLRHLIPGISIVLLAGSKSESRGMVHLDIFVLPQYSQVLCLCPQDDRWIDPLRSSRVILGRICPRPMLRQRAQNRLWRIN